MARPKKIVEETKVEVSIENENDSHILIVMTRDTRKIVQIDANKEKDWKTKYLHRTGVEFN